ncbi:peroxiredoxin-like family protein [Cohnella cellulosilytica]|uniref:thioredoxin-dependent peroxiredoxin n=1 Tax=Cohnella cellulosilytica TaxID=986710 RepID=A0ABW2FK05_9BACL
MTTLALNEQLSAIKQQFIAATPAEAHLALSRFIQEQQNSGLYNGLEAGSKTKDFVLKNALGHSVSLYETLYKGPVVLTFYRGGWCPYCNTQLRAYQSILPQIREMGGQLIAVSPQSPDNTLSQVEKEQLTFEVLSDTNGLVAARYNLLCDVPEYVRNVLEGFGLDLAEYNQTDKWILPVPATFMIDENAIIRSAYVNADFMQRMEPDDILHELGKL